MITELLVSAASVASGGLLGVGGAIITKVIDVFQENKKEQRSLELLKEQNKHSLAIMDKEAEIIKQEAAAAVATQEVKTAGEVEAAGYEAMANSYAADKSTYSTGSNHPWLVYVDIARGSIRPLLTMFFSAVLVGITIFFIVRIPTKLLLNEAFVTATFTSLLDTILFLTTTLVGWWFAARPQAKRK